MIERTAITVGSYDDLADEYYDEALHPTCADFRAASRLLLEDLLPRDWERMLEVGAGDSLVAEVVASYRSSLDGLLITDASPRMLGHSEEWRDRGAELQVASAEDLPLAAGAADVVVASLGDPFNSHGWWAEARRVVHRAGRVIFTTPSYEWATTFRDGAASPNVASFVRADGREVHVPSTVVAPGAQVERMRRAGLRVIAQPAATLEALGRPRSWKLDGLAGGDPVVTAYVAVPE